MNKVVLLFSFIIIILCTACEEDYYEKTSQNGYDSLVPIINELRNDESFSKFVELLEKTGVDDLLVKGTVYSVFAPVNEAIDAYNAAYPEKSTFVMDSADLRDFVEYHIAFGIYYEYDFGKQYYANGLGRYQTRMFDKQFNQYKNVSVFSEYFFREKNSDIEYEEIYGKQYDAKDSTFFVDASKVLGDKTDISCSNGVIHGIDEVILPRPNIFELLRSDPQFSDYFSFINRYDTLIPNYTDGVVTHYNMRYWYTDKDGSRKEMTTFPYNDEDEDATVFAPTNKVLEDFFGPYKETFDGDIKNLPDDIVMDLLANNFAHKALYSSRLYKEQMKKSIITGLSRVIYDPLSYIDEEPLVASNGFVYPVKKLMAQRTLSSVTGRILLDPQFESYRYVMEETGYLNAIAGATYPSNEFLFGDRVNYPKSWTLIVPLEVVFTDSLIESIYDKSVGELKSIARFHIIPDTIYLEPGVESNFSKGTFTSSFDNGYYQTYSGTYMRKSGNTLYSAMFSDSTAQIVGHVSGSNGVIYLVDDILYDVRSSFTVMSQLNSLSNSILTIFDELRNGQHSDLINDELLNTRGEYTLFFPTDQAMKAYDVIAESNPQLLTWGEMSTEERDVFIRNHLIRSRIMVEDGTLGTYYSSIGNKITVYKERGEFKVTGSNEAIPGAVFTSFNKQGANGVVNLVDQVIIP